LTSVKWVDIRHQLPWLGHAGIYLVNEAAQADLVNALAALGFKIIMLDGAVGPDEAAFFEEVRRAFGFSYMGKNWDAFHDCCGDLSYGDDRHLAILWTHASITLAQNLALLVKGVHEFLVATRYLSLADDEGAQPIQVELFLLGNTASFDRVTPQQ